MQVGDIVDVPDKTEIILEDYTVDLGTNQDRTTDKLFAILKQEEKIKYLITFTRVKDTRFVVSEIYEPDIYDVDTIGYFETTIKRGFIGGHIHFYVEDYNLYNRKHQVFATFAPETVKEMLIFSLLYPISTDKYIVHTEFRFYLFWDEEIIVLQGSDQPILYPNTIVLESLLVKSFYDRIITKLSISKDPREIFKDEVIVNLKSLDSVESVISYLKREMLFSII